MADTKLSTEEIDSILVDLKAKGMTLSECINYFRQNYLFDLSYCKDIVLDSKVYINERDAYIRNHDEAELEFFQAMADDARNSDNNNNNNKTNNSTKNSLFNKIRKFIIRHK